MSNMLIKEVEDLLQISSYTLRYYEKMGLVNPSRDENGYRIYSNEDIQNLKKVRFLRELEIPIEDINEIISNATNFQTVLEDHINKLSHQIKSLEYVKDVCNDLKEKDLPLLDVMIDNSLIIESNIDDTKMKTGLKKVVAYLKPIKTVVLGARIAPREYLQSSLFCLVGAIFFSLGITVGLPNIISFINEQMALAKQSTVLPTYQPTMITFIIGLVVCFIIIALIVSRSYSKSNYIELTDRKLFICSPDFQSKMSIYLGIILKDAEKRNKQYDYHQILSVKLSLIFSTAPGRGGVWHTYVPQFTFNFNDGKQYIVQTDKTYGEDSRGDYNILKLKGVVINGEQNVIDFYEQSELKLYDYFEAIYKHNSKN